MKNLAVVGAQWGDEGKGKIVDLLAPRFQIVARWAGGHNAGHTVVVNERKLVLKLIPSGILHDGVVCVIGNGTVIDLASLFAEIDGLKAMGIDVTGRLRISDRAHVILPYHRERDASAESKRGETKIGTTGRGIGPAYVDKCDRSGIRVGDLVDTSASSPLSLKVWRHVTICAQLTSTDLDARQILKDLRDAWTRLQPMVTDVSVFLYQAMNTGQPVLFEGAQGTMLDIDHGTYPYVTSSSSTVGGACTGLGVAPRYVHNVLGVAKAYTTRVGEGPFPTELSSDPVGAQLRIRGHEFGSVTGRPRRCGWFDAVVVRHAARINGLNHLAMTKLDVLDGLAEVLICIGYRYHDMLISDFPADLNLLASCEPVYETMPGWTKPTAGISRYQDLASEAQAYLCRIEQLTGVSMALVSTGADRVETIVLDESLLVPQYT